MLFATVCMMPASPTYAQTRVFVAAQGADANPCTFALPCRTFQHAHDVVASGGEIDVLDPAGYGPLSITKAISIQGHGFAGISTSSGGTAIEINATALDIVSLNGLLLEGSGVGFEGIHFIKAKALVVDDCVVRNFTLVGLSAEFASAQWLSVSNSIFDGNGGHGILLQPSVPMTATIDRSVMRGNGSSGLSIVGNTGAGALNVTVTDSVAANNWKGAGDQFGDGFVVDSDQTTNSQVDVLFTRIAAFGNRVGVYSFGNNATVSLAQSTVTGNDTGYAVANNGTFNTYGDNYIDANVHNSSGPLVSISKQ
jgi:hypothetical protein